MDKVIALLENNKPIHAAEWTSSEVEKINELLPNLITAKPVVYLINLSKADFIRKKNKFLAKIHAWVTQSGGTYDSYYDNIIVMDDETNCWMRQPNKYICT